MALSSKLNIDEFMPDPTFRESVKKFTELLFDKEKCKEDPDCEDLKSPCCSKGVIVIFGSFPVEVECIECKQHYRLRDLILGGK